MWDFYNLQPSRQENFGFFPFAGGAFIFAVKLYNEMFAWAFYKDLSYSESNCPFIYLFLFIFFIHYIAFLKGLLQTTLPCFLQTA